MDVLNRKCDPIPSPSALCLICGLQAEDVPFVLRIVVQALLPGTPADVATEAQDLSSRVQTAVPADFDVTSSTLGLDELCPACHAQVPLNDITSATCPSGHVWGMSFSPRGVLASLSCH